MKIKVKVTLKIEKIMELDQENYPVHAGESFYTQIGVMTEEQILAHEKENMDIEARIVEPALDSGDFFFSIEKVAE